VAGDVAVEGVGPGVELDGSAIFVTVGVDLEPGALDVLEDQGVGNVAGVAIAHVHLARRCGIGVFGEADVFTGAD